MNILHVTETLKGASGVATFVRELNEGLRVQGVDSRVGRSWELGVKSCELGGTQKPDVVHIHGLWLGMYHKAAVWARGNGVPVVWSTHGMTAPWSMRHKWWKKLPAWLLYQKRDLKRAAAIHCTTEQEVEWNKALGFKDLFVAPLGTRESCGLRVEEWRSEGVLLFVGRIHPVKGLENLIRAWGLVVSRESLVACGKRWKLRFVGPDEGNYLSCLASLVSRLGIGDSVEFVGPKFGDELSREYEECDCLVLPSFTENFGATVVDAMAHGKPCIASAFTPWKVLQDRGCGWWVDNKPDSLAKAIQEMIEIGDDKRRAMGEIGRRLVEERYTWEAVTDKLIKVYESII